MNNLEITSAILLVFSLSPQPCSGSIIRHILKKDLQSQTDYALLVCCVMVLICFKLIVLHLKIQDNFTVYFPFALVFIFAKVSAQMLCCPQTGLTECYQSGNEYSSWPIT